MTAMINKNSSTRVVFMGTPEFSAYILEKLIEAGINIAGVITVPDKPAGRGQKLTQSAVKQTALHYGLTILQPEKLKDTAFISELNKLNPDLQIVIAFRMLPEVVWKLPPKGTFNLHASLLPQYRGAAPINHVIINGEKETGVTTFFIDNKIDTGNIIFNEKIAIDEDETAGTLHDKLMIIGTNLVLKTIKAIEDGTAKLIPQPQIPEREIKTAPKIFKEDCRINWENPADKIINKINGLSPYPTAFCELYDSKDNLKRLKIFSASKSDTSNLKPGKTFSNGTTFLEVGTATNDIKLKEIQLEGKKRLKIEDFLRGNKDFV
jgi:methionyl-tRNA formyltransferase